MATITVGIEGANEVDRWLDEARNRAVDLTPVFRTVFDPGLTKFFEEQFATNGQGKWPALKESTLKAKRRINRGKMGTLRRFDTLWSSLVNEDNPSSIHTVGPLLFERGTSIGYAAIHNEGGSKIPKREILPRELPKGLIDEWTAAISKYLEG